MSYWFVHPIVNVPGTGKRIWGSTVLHSEYKIHLNRDKPKWFLLKGDAKSIEFIKEGPKRLWDSCHTPHRTKKTERIFRYCWTFRYETSEKRENPRKKDESRGAAKRKIVPNFVSANISYITHAFCCDFRNFLEIQTTEFMIFGITRILRQLELVHQTQL